MKKIEAVLPGMTFKDNDPRTQGERILEVVKISKDSCFALCTVYYDKVQQKSPVTIRCDRLLKGTERTGYSYRGTKMI